MLGAAYPLQTMLHGGVQAAQTHHIGCNLHKYPEHFLIKRGDTFFNFLLICCAFYALVISLDSAVGAVHGHNYLIRENTGK